MDNRSRQGVAGMPTKSCVEMNGGAGRQHPRRKTLSKKVRGQSRGKEESAGYRSMSEFQPPPSCWMPQRLFPAVSDSAVGGYPVSMGFSMDQMPYPLYQPVFPHPAMVAMTPHLHSKRCTHADQPPNSEYTSLPPGNVIDCQSDHQRRFSDPGLANGVDSEEDDSGDAADDLSNCNLSDRVNSLAKENHRLQAELKETRLQLHELKLEMTAWKESHPTYEPGMVSDLVCEVREAMKVHQEAFLARLKQTTPQVNDRLTVKEFDDLKKKLQNVTNEKEDLNDRLKRLEEQMQTVMVHNSLQDSNQQELVVLEQEKLKLRRELQEEIDARKTAESQFRSLEQVLGALRKKKINGIVEDKMAERDTDHVTSGESLMSSLGSGSMHSPHVTMSGPVTDL